LLVNDLNNLLYDMNIRNFVIIAHIDHGKSTLADRLLELTQTITQRKMREQFLDTMELERERGITIKLQPVRMNFRHSNEDYILNLIDTPGHIDFNYEVSRALAAVEGAILLVDATQGIQAQTLANLRLAQKECLKIIGIINKIDLVNDEKKIEELKIELAQLIGQEPDEILSVSAKTGKNVGAILEKVVKEVPAPERNLSKSFRALIFDSHFDAYKGVIAYVKIVDGEITKQKPLVALATGAKTQSLEIGVFHPELVVKNVLTSGEIGYIATGLKEPQTIRVGDTLANSFNVEPITGYFEPQPMVWASFYPESADDYDTLKDALLKLKLNDASLHFEPEFQEALGRGFRIGFLGMLHLDITAERLKREYDLRLVITTPTVSYKILNKKSEVRDIFSAADWPDPSNIGEIQEPWVTVAILSPTRFLGGLMKIMESYRSVYRETQYLGEDYLILKFDMPLSEILVDFHDRLKSVSEGYASMSYELIGHRTGDLVKLQVLIASEPVEAFSKIVPRETAYNQGLALVKKLKEIVPKQNFAIAIQAAIGGKVIARETISALRKDVTGYLYGGDVTRKKKLLEKQKKGKKKLKAIGRVHLPSEVYLDMFRKSQ